MYVKISRNAARPRAPLLQLLTAQTLKIGMSLAQRRPKHSQDVDPESMRRMKSEELAPSGRDGGIVHDLECRKACRRVAYGWGAAIEDGVGGGKGRCQLTIALGRQRLRRDQVMKGLGGNIQCSRASQDRCWGRLVRRHQVIIPASNVCNRSHFPPRCPFDPGDHALWR